VREQLRIPREYSHVSGAHELSGLGSTRVVRFSASVGRRIDEPDDVATGRDVLSRWERWELSTLEAAELLGMSERQFRRYRGRFEEEGEAGLLDRRLGKVSPKRIEAAEVARMLHLYRKVYRGWNVKHFHEHGVRAPVRLGLHLDQDAAEYGGRGGAGETARRPRGRSRRARSRADGCGASACLWGRPTAIPIREP
jgi:Winged helix-turn helix